MSRTPLSLLAAAVLCAAAATPAAAQAQKHALLVGVSNYTYLPQAFLEGPQYDVPVLQKTLVERWGFAPANVTVLMDAASTKAAILAAIDKLAVTTRPGDFVFIYFSGHGTSGFDAGFAGAGIDGSSGAIIPADLKPGPPEVLREGLIIGNRDLTPRLLKIDRDRKVLVAFDSCYSGNAARSLFALGKSRYISPSVLLKGGASRSLGSFGDEEESSKFAASTAQAAPYPYQNVVYISGSTKEETAKDIDSDAIAKGKTTFDGKPHGAMSNALIQGLNGAANANRDDRISYQELYDFVRDKVTGGFPQTPQLLAPAGADLLQAPVLGGGAAAPASAGGLSAAGGFRVKLDKVAGPLAQKIGSLPGVGVVTGAYDLLVVQEAGGFKLVHASGDVLASYSAAQAQEVADRVARQVAVQQLLDLSFPAQDFNVSVDVPGNRGALRPGDSFTIDFTAEKDAYVLVFDVDNEGYVSVLYPFNEAEMKPTRSGRIPPGGDVLKVSPPYGTEYLKVVAFKQKPAGFERWKGADDLHFSPMGRELGELLQMIKSAPGSKAAARLKVVTRG